ncbi:MAG TPA: hypothetical protein PLK82_04060 [Bacteroidales bacterium]|nr:hypothetical protein [Bacteroidales bacterium]
MKRLLVALFVLLFTFPALSRNGGITVLTPNGGETWIAGSPAMIQWTNTNTAGPVRVDLFKANALFMTVAPQVAPGITSITWIPPVTIVTGSDYKVKVTSLTSSAGYDFSDNFFAIVAPVTNQVKVVTPNGGENWIIGCQALIQWISTSAAPFPVKIELYRNDAYYLTISAQVPAGQMSFTWIPPVSVMPGNTYKVKVSCMTATGTVPVYDFSDGYFSISKGVITVSAPNGGEAWMKGSIHPILWVDNVCSNVRIELWKGGAFHSLIAASVPSNGFFNWMIPNTATLVPGQDYKVKILALMTAANTTGLVYDFSDNNFTLLPGSPGITPALCGKVRVFPNPFADELSVELPESMEGNLVAEVVGDAAKPLLSKEIACAEVGRTFRLNTSGLPSGRYLLLLKVGDRVIFNQTILHRP